MTYLHCRAARPHVYAFSHFFFFIDPATTEIYTLSLHDALPISPSCTRSSASVARFRRSSAPTPAYTRGSSTLCNAEERRSEEHTSELQSRRDLVCRLLLEKKKKVTERTQQAQDEVTCFSRI